MPIPHLGYYMDEESFSRKATHITVEPSSGLTYKYGEPFDINDITVTVYYEDGTNAAASAGSAESRNRPRGENGWAEQQTRASARGTQWGTRPTRWDGLYSTIYHSCSCGLKQNVTLTKGTRRRKRSDAKPWKKRLTLGENKSHWVYPDLVESSRRKCG